MNGGLPDFPAHGIGYELGVLWGSDCVRDNRCADRVTCILLVMAPGCLAGVGLGRPTRNLSVDIGAMPSGQRVLPWPY